MESNTASNNTPYIKNVEMSFSVFLRNCGPNLVVIAIAMEKEGGVVPRSMNKKQRPLEVTSSP
jgi:hypothetical protein